MRYVRRLESKHTAMPLTRGSMLHAVLEAYHDGRSWIKEWRKQKEEFEKDKWEQEILANDIPEMIRELMENYVKRYEADDMDKEFIFNEAEFKIPLVKCKDHEGVETQIYLKGFIDAIYEENGKVYIKDYKTYAQTPPRDFFVYNYQSAIYLWAYTQGIELPDGRILKGRPTAMVWDVIRAKMPSKPELLASGELSNRKLASTPYTVIKGLKELGLNPKEHVSLVEKHSYDDFFNRYEVRYNHKSVEFMMEDIKQTAIQLCQHQHEFKDFNLATKYPSSFKDLWQTEVSGGDVEWMIKQNYKERAEHNDKESKKEKYKEKSKRKRN